MYFKKIKKSTDMNEDNTVYLIYDYWDDFSYCTTFIARYYENVNSIHRLGILKISCENLNALGEKRESQNGFDSYSVNDVLKEDRVESLPNAFFSLGQDIDYYKKVIAIFGERSEEYFLGIKDLAYNIERFNELYKKREVSLTNSLMRTLYYSSVEQFSRIINGESELTKYKFDIKYRSEIINIEVNPEKFPPDNIHILIGRNGVGKSWLLHNIVYNLMNKSDLNYKNFNISKKYEESKEFSIEQQENSFSGIIGISFSVFDDALTFTINDKESKRAKELEELRKIYKYIGVIEKGTKESENKESIDALRKVKIYIDNKNKGLIKSTLKIEEYLENIKKNLGKKEALKIIDEFYLYIDDVNMNSNDKSLIYMLKEVSVCLDIIKKDQLEDIKVRVKSVQDLCEEFVTSLENIKKFKSKIKLYSQTIANLESDLMFSNNGFIELLNGFMIGKKEINEVKYNFEKLSSGHMIIILSLTLLTETIQEKTIVVIDEPETHLHPPLLSTYMRTLSFLLTMRNAVAIIATHSPIILQEVPARCVNKVTRSGSDMQFEKIDSETFASSTDLLTREVFGLEVIKTGFYKMITDNLEEDLEETLEKFNNEIGFLGQTLIQSILWKKRLKNEKD